MDFNVVDRIDTHRKRIQNKLHTSPTFKKLDGKSIDINGSWYNVDIYTSSFKKDIVEVSLERTPDSEKWDIYASNSFFEVWNPQRRRVLKAAKQIRDQVLEEIG